MIEKLHQVILYMDDLETAKDFWVTKIGFHLLEDVEINGVRQIVIAPSEQAETKLLLYDKHLFAQMSPELNLDIPSLKFQTTNIRQFQKHLHRNNVKVSELIMTPLEISFHFYDEEQNNYSVFQKN